MKPDEVRREGDDFLARWDDLGLGLAFTRVRETDSSVRALVTPVRLEDRKRLLAPVWSNLFTLADRERLAKALRERIEGTENPSPSDWKDAVEHAFSAVIDLQTTPEPLLDLSVGRPSADEGHLVWPILARNQINEILADQKAGKSYAGLVIAVAVAANLPDALPAPWRLLGSGPVVYYDAETDFEAQQRRLHRVCAGLGLPRVPRIHYRRLRPPLVNHASAMRADVARTGAVLVIVDSLTYAAGGDLNTTESAVPTMNAIHDLGDGATKLVVCHHGKAGRRDGEQPSVIGSATFEFKARNVWLLRRESEPGADHIDQAWTHRYASDSRLERGFGLRLQFDPNNTKVTFDSLSASESAWVARHSGTAEDKIRAALLDTDFYKLSLPDLAKATGLSDRHVRRTVERMADVRLAAGGRPGQGNVSVFELCKNGSGVTPMNRTIGHAYRDESHVRFGASAPIGQSDISDTGRIGHVRFGDEGTDPVGEEAEIDF